MVAAYSAKRKIHDDINSPTVSSISSDDFVPSTSTPTYDETVPVKPDIVPDDYDMPSAIGKKFLYKENATSLNTSCKFLQNQSENVRYILV